MVKFNLFSDDIDPGPSFRVIPPEFPSFDRSDAKDLMEIRASIDKSELSPKEQFFYIYVNLKLVPGCIYELYQCAKRVIVVLRAIDPGMELIKIENKKHVYPQNIILREFTKKNMHHYVTEQNEDPNYFGFQITVTTHIHKLHRYLNHWLRESPHSIRTQVIRQIRTSYIAVAWLLRSTANTVNRADFAEYLEEVELKHYNTTPLVREKHATIRDGNNNILSKEALYIYIDEKYAQAVRTLFLREGFAFRQRNFSRLTPCPICMESGINTEKQMVEDHIDYLKKSVTVKVQLNGKISSEMEKTVGLMVKKCLRLTHKEALKIDIATIFANKLSFTGSAMYTPSFRDDLQSIKNELKLDFTVSGPTASETKLEKRMALQLVKTDASSTTSSKSGTPVHSNVSLQPQENIPEHKLGSIQSSLNDLNKRVDAVEKLISTHFDQIFASINTHIEVSKRSSLLLEQKIDNNRVFLENNNASVSKNLTSISKDLSKLKSKVLKTLHDEVISSVGDELKGFETIMKDSLSTSKQAFTLVHTFRKEMRTLLKGGIVLPPSGVPPTPMTITSPVSQKTDITDVTNLTPSTALTNVTDSTEPMKTPVTPTVLVHKFNPMAYDETPDEKLSTVSDGGSLQEEKGDTASLGSDNDSLNYSAFVHEEKDSSKKQREEIAPTKKETLPSVPTTIQNLSTSTPSLSSSLLVNEEDDDSFTPVGKTGKPKVTIFSEKVQIQKEQTSEPPTKQIKSEPSKQNVKLTKLKQTSLSTLYSCTLTRRSNRLKQHNLASVEESKSQE